MPAKHTANIQIGTDGSQIKGGFQDGNGVPRHGWEAIFPIVQIVSDTEWIPIATGFFISNNGLFATAKHVLTDTEGGLLPSLFGVQVLHELNEIIVREIVKIDLHPLADVALGFLVDRAFVEHGVQTVNKFLGLTSKMPDSGERIVTYSFPKTIAFQDENGRALNFTSAASEGLFEEFQPEGRDRVMLPGPCIRTSMPLAPGSSGGPVAFGDGWIFGINGTGWDGTDLSYLSPVSSLLELAVHYVRLLHGRIRERVTVAELVEMGLVCFDGATDDAPMAG